MARVVLEHLTKTFPSPGEPKVVAVDDVSLTVESEDLVVLLGPSGCGKTTLLRLIAGLEQPESGSISIDGKDVTRLPPKNRDLAMVFQHHALYPHLTLYDNMGFGLMLRHTPRPDIDRAVRDAAQMLDLADCLFRLPREVSGGQKQRASLGRALVRRPRLILLDEPLSDLDAPLRNSLRTVVARIHRETRSTMIYVTHDQTEAMMLAKRLAIMKNGAIQQSGDPLSIYRNPRNLSVAAFLGWPAMNLIRGTVAQRGAAFFFEEESSNEQKFILPLEGSSFCRAALCGRPVIFGIRSEAVSNGASPDLASIEGIVESVEPVGADTYIHVRKGGVTIVSRTAAHDRPALNQKRVLHFDLRAAQLFDAANSEVIVPLAE